jgi:uncharacterized protein YkwD
MAATQCIGNNGFSSRIVDYFPRGGARIAIDSWINNYHHNANIIGRFDLIGIGLAYGGDGNVYVCVDFDS